MSKDTPSARNQAYYASLNYPQLLFFILQKKGIVNLRSSTWFQKVWDAYYYAVTECFFMKSNFKDKAKGVPNVDKIADAISKNDLFEEDYRKALRERAEKIIQAQIKYKFKVIVKQRNLDESKLVWGKQDTYYVEAAEAVWQDYYAKVKSYPEDVDCYPELKVAKYLADRMKSPMDYFKVPDFLVSAETWTSAFLKINSVLAGPIIGQLAAGGFVASVIVSGVKSAVDSALSEAVAYQYGDAQTRNGTDVKTVLLKVGKSALIGAVTSGLSKAGSDLASTTTEKVLSKILDGECQMLDTLFNKAYDQVITGKKQTVEVQDIVTNMVNFGLSFM